MKKIRKSINNNNKNKLKAVLCNLANSSKWNELKTLDVKIDLNTIIDDVNNDVYGSLEECYNAIFSTLTTITLSTSSPELIDSLLLVSDFLLDLISQQHQLDRLSVLSSKQSDEIFKALYYKMKSEGQILEPEKMLPDHKCGGTIMYNIHVPCSHKITTSNLHLTPQQMTASLADVDGKNGCCIECVQKNLLAPSNTNYCRGIATVEGEPTCQSLLASSGKIPGIVHVLDVCLPCILHSQGFCSCKTCIKKLEVGIFNYFSYIVQ